MINVAIVEDTDTLREKLEGLIRASGDCTLVASYRNGVQAVANIHKLDVDVVLMDVSMPGLNGIEAVSMLRSKMKNTQFLMITVFDDSETIMAALTSGASGYIVKKSTDEQILQAIRQMHNGGAPMSHDVARKVIDSLQQARRPVDGKLADLSDREREIFGLLCNGDSYETMAEKFFLSRETVKKHVHNIYKKLGVENRAQAIRRFKP